MITDDSLIIEDGLFDESLEGDELLADCVDRAGNLTNLDGVIKRWSNRTRVPSVTHVLIFLEDSLDVRGTWNQFADYCEMSFDEMEVGEGV